MKIRKKIGDLGKEQIQQLVQDFLDELGEGAVALLDHFEESDNPEFLEVELDEENKILSFTAKDGSHYFYNLKSETIDALAQALNDLADEVHNIPQLENFENIEDIEGRVEIKKDKEQKILSYRDSKGVLHETAGIDTPEINLSKEGLDKLADELDIPLPETVGLYRSPNLPKYGTTNIKTETFYLTAVDGLTSLSQIELIQDFEDTAANASDRMTIYHYYFNNARLRHYAASKVEERNGEYYAKETVRKVGNAWYYADTLGYSGGRTKVIEGYTEMYNGPVPETGNYALIETKVIMFTAPCCVGAWTIEDWDYNAVEGTDIGKKYEHYCVCDIDFGHYLTKTNAYIGVKHQGNSTQGYRKRNYRYTFYKKNDYNKKEKIKIGEMLRLSKFNLKANWVDNTRIKELILYRIFTQIWQNRPIIDRYNWDGGANGLYHGVTGNYNGFPIALNVKGEFYGIYNFDLPKDGKNYMIDDEDESTGLFVSGAHNTANDWGITYPYNITDPLNGHYDSEMDSDFSEYPMIVMAIGAWTGFINNRMYKAEDGKGYDLFQCTFRGADSNYYNYGQVTYDDETGKWYHDNVEIIRIFVTDMYWDSNHNTYHRVFTTEIDNTRYVTATLDPETGQPTQDSVTVTHFDLTDELIPFDRENIAKRLDVLGFIDYMICMQLFVMYDNQHNNILMYSGPEKEKMFPFFYDLDGSIQENREGGAEADIFADGVSLSNDMSLWRNLRDEYWDDMVNRYCQLRKTYLSLDYIKSVYNDIAGSIPAEDVSNEVNKWGAGNPANFNSKLDFLTERLQWLDESYFNI